MASDSKKCEEKSSDERGHSLEYYNEIANFLLGKTKYRPEIGIVAGSGLGDVADKIANPDFFEYAEIPHFPRTTAHGHRGRLVFGYLGGKCVVCMQGRVHTYEGYSASDVVMKMMGVENLFVANAAGGLNQRFRTGDIMLINDHVCFPALTGPNVLTGANDDRLGPRFPDMTACYTPKLLETARTIAATMGLGWRVHEGAYMMIAGPAYATRAECKLLKLLGGDAVGMSNCWEVMAAHHCDMQVFALCVITDVHKEPNELLTHEEVLEVSSQSATDVSKLFVKLIEAL